MSAQGVGVVFDLHGCSFGGSEGVDAEQVGQSAVVDGDGVGDLQEPGQLDPVQSLSAGLVAVDLGRSCVDGRVGGEEAVDLGEAEVAANSVHHRVDRGVHQASVAELSDVELRVGSLDPEQRVGAVGLAPGEPLG